MIRYDSLSYLLYCDKNTKYKFFQFCFFRQIVFLNVFGLLKYIYYVKIVLKNRLKNKYRYKNNY